MGNFGTLKSIISNIFLLTYSNNGTKSFINRFSDLKYEIRRMWHNTTGI